MWFPTSPTRKGAQLLARWVGSYFAARRDRECSGVAAVLALGAQAAWPRTRFLLAEEIPTTRSIAVNLSARRD
jgi:hypothetical protein